MNEELEHIMGEALDLLEQGASVEAILARYPAEATELRPFLLTAAQLSRLATQPSVPAEARSRRAFLAAAEPAPAARGGWFARRLAPALAVLAVVMLAGALLAGATAGAVPGSPFYGAKRALEDARLALAADPTRAATLREEARQSRLREVRQLLAEGREAAVTLTGVIEEMAEDGMGGYLWRVDGVPVAVSELTILDGTPAPGALVEVSGRTRAGGVQAERVRVMAAGPERPPTISDDTPEPSPPASPTPGATPDLATKTPPPDANPTASRTVAPAATRTASAPSRTTEPPSATPPTPEPPATADFPTATPPPPATEPPATEPPTATPPTPEPPATEPPATGPPATEPPTKTPPPETSPTPDDDDNGNDNDDDNDNDDNENDNDDNGNDNDNDNGGG